MKVILKYVPKNTTYKQIFHFLKPTLNGGLFSKFGKIKCVSVLAHKHRLSQTVDFHVILDIQPDEVAKRVVNKLHRNQLNGRHIDVIEYIERSIYNFKSTYTAESKYPNLDYRDLTRRFKLIKIEELKDFIWTENVEIL
jgi:hypothetical protein